MFKVSIEWLSFLFLIACFSLSFLYLLMMNFFQQKWAHRRIALKDTNKHTRNKPKMNNNKEYLVDIIFILEFWEKREKYLEIGKRA